MYLIREEIRARCEALTVITDALPLLRGLIARRRQQREVAALALAVTPIQAGARGWLVRRRCARQLFCATVVQAYVRGWLTRKAAGPHVRTLYFADSIVSVLSVDPPVCYTSSSASGITYVGQVLM